MISVELRSFRFFKYCLKRAIAFHAFAWLKFDMGFDLTCGFELQA